MERVHQSAHAVRERKYHNVQATDHVRDVNDAENGIRDLNEKARRLKEEWSAKLKEVEQSKEELRRKGKLLEGVKSSLVTGSAQAFKSAIEGLSRELSQWTGEVSEEKMAVLQLTERYSNTADRFRSFDAHTPRAKIFKEFSHDYLNAGFRELCRIDDYRIIKAPESFGKSDNLRFSQK